LYDFFNTLITSIEEGAAESSAQHAAAAAASAARKAAAFDEEADEEDDGEEEAEFNAPKRTAKDKQLQKKKRGRLGIAAKAQQVAFSSAANARETRSQGLLGQRGQIHPAAVEVLQNEVCCYSSFSYLRCVALL
jgi:hypothetical protein